MIEYLTEQEVLNMDTNYIIETKNLTLSLIHISNDWNLPQTENAYQWFLAKLTFLMDEEPATSETVAQIRCV